MILQTKNNSQLVVTSPHTDQVLIYDVTILNGFTEDFRDIPIPVSSMQRP